LVSLVSHVISSSRVAWLTTNCIAISALCPDAETERFVCPVH
jgi:hypothetical protein